MNNSSLIVIACFWLCACGALYTYAIYPIILHVLSRRFGSDPEAQTQSDELPPSISLLIAAHNEEAVIASRIENALRLEYPRDKLEIVIASDGSTDKTPLIVRGYESQGVRLLHDPARRGKAAVLTSAFSELRGEIVLLSDANTFTDADAAKSLARWFADRQVGAVCGRLILTDPLNGMNVDSLYWRYETFLKIREARLGGLLGSNGAIYAIRRSSFIPIPKNTIMDDFVIPLLAKLRTGCRIIYDADAIAREETAPNLAVEFHRRSRIGAGGWQAIMLLWPLLNPVRGWIAFTFFSHKVLRWLCPFFLLGMLASSAALWARPSFRILLFLQLIFYVASPLANRLPREMPLGHLLRLGNMFVLMNAALLVGFFRWLRGGQDGTWTRTARSDEAQPQLVQA